MSEPRRPEPDDRDDPPRKRGPGAEGLRSANEGRSSRCAALSLVLAGLAVGNLGAGCSFAAVKGPPPVEMGPRAPLNCTTTYTPPIMDLLLAAGGLTAAAVAAGNSSYEENGQQADQGMALFMPAVLAGVFIGSAVTGFRRVSACNKRIESLSPRASDGARPARRVVLVPVRPSRAAAATAAPGAPEAPPATASSAWPDGGVDALPPSPADSGAEVQPAPATSVPVAPPPPPIRPGVPQVFPAD